MVSELTQEDTRRMCGRVPVPCDATGHTCDMGHGPPPTFGPKHNHVHAAVGRLRRSRSLYYPQTCLPTVSLGWTQGDGGGSEKKERVEWGRGAVAVRRLGRAFRRQTDARLTSALAEISSMTIKSQQSELRSYQTLGANCECKLSSVSRPPVANSAFTPKLMPSRSKRPNRRAVADFPAS